MSGPTRGMVAGQPITTAAQTKEYDEGFERTFGASRGKRGRFVYTQGGEPLPEPVEVSDDWQNREKRAQTVTEELVYGQAGATTDGTLINTRKRHREYMQRNGLAMASDYSAAYQEKEARSRELSDDKSRRATIERAFYTQTQGTRRK